MPPPRLRSPYRQPERACTCWAPTRTTPARGSTSTLPPAG
jgi:hypothetical protein